MRTILFLLVFINPILTNCTSNNNSEPILRITFRAVYNLPKNNLDINDSLLYFLIDLDIINESDKSCDFITYNCASGANVVIDSKYFKVCANNCGSNSIQPIRLKQNGKLTLPIILVGNRYDLDRNFTLGWIVTTNYDNFKKATEEGRIDLVDVIWSKPIQLHISGGQIFTISK